MRGGGGGRGGGFDSFRENRYEWCRRGGVGGGKLQLMVEPFIDNRLLSPLLVLFPYSLPPLFPPLGEMMAGDKGHHRITCE